MPSKRSGENGRVANGSCVSWNGGGQNHPNAEGADREAGQSFRDVCERGSPRPDDDDHGIPPREVHPLWAIAPLFVAFLVDDG